MKEALDAEDGLFPQILKPGPRVRSALRGALDLIFPPQALDGGTALAGGISAEGWSRIHFLDGPVCDGCGVPFDYDIGSRKIRAMATFHPAYLLRQPIYKRLTWQDFRAIKKALAQAGAD